MDKFIFIHIPKTAGTSLHSALIDRGLITSPTFNANYLNSSTAISLNDYRCIYGHLSYMDGLKYFKNREYLTVLREPVERAISWYWYAKNNVVGNWSDDALMAKSLSIAWV